MFKVALIMMNFVQKDGSGKDKSILVIPWDVVALKGALLPTEIWEIPGDHKISPNMREGNENSTGGDVHYHHKCVFYQSEYFPSSPGF